MLGVFEKYIGGGPLDDLTAALAVAMQETGLGGTAPRVLGAAGKLLDFLAPSCYFVL